MRRNLLRWTLEIFFLTILASGGLKAQFAQLREDIYMKDESSMSVGLLDISEHKIKYKNEVNKVKTIDASEVLMIFNKVGEYLIYPCKDLNSFKAESFVKSTALPPADLLVNLDRSLIPARIIAKNENDIVYENTEEPNGEQFISKDLVAAIIYKSGNHELLVSPSEAAKVLAAESSAINNFRMGMSIKSQSIPKETTKPVATVTQTKETVANERKPAQGQLETTTPQYKETITASAKENPKNPETSATPVIPATSKAPVETASSTSVTESKSTTSIQRNDTASYPSNLNLELFSKKALEKTKELSVYLNIISDKASDFQQANKAIDQACALFVSEDARVEISTNKGQDYKVRFRIREYLNRLKLLKYDKVEISWTNINYVSNFRKGPDGNYYGLITLQQRFNGLMEGRVVYSDITKKNIEVVLKSYNKEVGGKTEQLWDVLLSDIGLVVAKTE